MARTRGTVSRHTTLSRETSANEGSGANPTTEPCIPENIDARRCHGGGALRLGTTRRLATPVCGGRISDRLRSTGMQVGDQDSFDEEGEKGEEGPLHLAMTEMEEAALSTYTVAVRITPPSHST